MVSFGAEVELCYLAGILPVGAGHSHGPQLPYPACLPIPEGEDAAPNPIICLQDGDLKTRLGKQEPQLPLLHSQQPLPVLLTTVRHT